ncbi:hypothetical protein [Clostridium tarantellae]|uniref:Uncharacterized protein n=1 Tax=Clostridium tarantellae TaxID=39493 RepID=A0A6I1MSS3_9CLOT|nr:hypothetical protein [Clostridium tarantellae]MPQ45202.1 hypothetical protein [Clostridium tarantellae]
MNKKILEALKDLKVPVLYGWYDESLNKTHITFFTFSEIPEDYSDDEYESIENYIQVDIWSKENVEGLKRKVKKAMKNKDFIYIDGRDQFEIDTKLYHKALRFYIANAEE